MNQPLRVLIVEDHHLFRSALEMSLSLDEQIEVVGSCESPEEAEVVARDVPFDILVTDLEWAGDPYGGIRLIHLVLSFRPKVGVLVCSAHEDREAVRRAIQAGAKGYLLKHEIKAPDVIRAVKSVGSGRPDYSESVVEVMTELLREAEVGCGPLVHPLDELTPREREVVALLMDELSNAEIAQRLGVSEKTVKTHVSSILQKLSLSSRYQVPSYIRRYGDSFTA